MALTRDDVARYEKVIADTGAQREVMFKARTIPEEYASRINQVEQTQVTIDVPAVNLPVTCYLVTAKDKKPDCPVHINLHGGGFYFGHTDDDDLYCAHLASELRGMVVDVDYALCPDHPFPIAFEQAYEVARWVFTMCAEWGANPKHVSMGGQSAGGNLTAAVALRSAATKDFKLCLQVLDYAALDVSVPVVEKIENGQEDPMNVRSFAFSMLYGEGDVHLLRTPFVSPSLAIDEMLDGLPPTLIVTGGQCPFRRIAEEYGIRLANRGTEVTIKRFRNSRHGFTVRMMDQWQESQNFIIRTIRRAGLQEGVK